MAEVIKLKTGRIVNYDPNDEDLKGQIIELLKKGKKRAQVAEQLNVSMYFVDKTKKEYNKKSSDSE